MKLYLLGLILSFSPLCLAETVRVLLDQSEEAPSFFFLGPTEFSSAKQKVSVYDSSVRLKIKKSKESWLLDIQRHQIKEKYRVLGERITLSSLGAIQWRDSSIDFQLHIVFQNNKYHLVGEMSMDRYLSGVIAHEMPASWPLEALKAQVIASRSYAYWKINNNRNDLYDLRPSVMDQVFQLPRWGQASHPPQSVERAIAATTGEVLQGERKKIIKTYFHSDCGGATISSEQAWGETNNGLSSVADKACQERKSSWSSQWSAQKIQDMMTKNLLLPPNAQLKSVMVRRQNSSERVEWVDFLFSNGIFKRLRGEDLRRLLGYDKIRSTTFKVVQSAGVWVFEGRGFGHGVGLCQHGARALASQGHPYSSILKHYYPHAQITNLSTKSPLKVSMNP
jgi:stage II sporulation protein D